MRLPTLIPTTFIIRLNRFLGIVDIDNHETECFIHNPGRMNELLYKGANIYLAKRLQSHRKTAYDVLLTEHLDNLVSIDSRIPNIILEEALRKNLIPEFHGYRVKKREPIYRDSRFDLQLTGPKRSMLLEVKSCTLVQNKVALFPDAPTKRGTRHLYSLIDSLNEYEACMIFIVQRNDSNSFRPNKTTDPDFLNALKEALLKGVKVLAYNSKVTFKGITINKRVPVEV